MAASEAASVQFSSSDGFVGRNFESSLISELCTSSNKSLFTFHYPNYANASSKQSLENIPSSTSIINYIKKLKLDAEQKLGACYQ